MAFVLFAGVVGVDVDVVVEVGCCCCCCWCCGDGVAKENWDCGIGEENDIFMFGIELDAANGDERVGV